MPLVFVIDDHDDCREVAEAFLQSEGADVRTFATAEDALAVLEDQVPDLVLTDLNLPGISGVELAARIRANERTKKLRIVALTGSDGVPAKVFDGILTKPFEPSDLAELVRK